jgi:isocitrate dehydrogenase (NAD+)
VHKANILKKADGMHLSVSREVAARYPGIRHDDIIVDALCMKLVRRPRDFDVLLCGNLFGDIVSDCAAGMAGGVTVATGICHAPNARIFEAAHGARLDELPPDGANPYATVLMAADLAAHLGQADAAVRIRASVQAALQAGVHTCDMGGSATRTQVRDALLKGLSR